MVITEKDEQALRQLKRVVEKIIKQGHLPNNRESIDEMFKVWNLVYKKNDKVTNCPTCRPKKFAQLKQTYDLYELSEKWNRKLKVKSKPKTKSKQKLK
tara:strand:+ start:677 stop:970 length:294 start_codon:yes stop_codon:yes gene_type:complete